MAFVPGYPRDLGWVKAHRRRPNRAEDGQLPLLGVTRPEDPAVGDGPDIDPDRPAEDEPGSGRAGAVLGRAVQLGEELGDHP